VRAYRFELSRVQVAAVRERMVAGLANVADDLAAAVAAGLGMEVPPPLPRAIDDPLPPEVEASPALSLMARPGDGTIRSRRVAILVDDGVDGAAALALHERLAAEGAVPRFVGVRLGRVTPEDGGAPIEVSATLETMPSVLFDAVAVPGGERAAKTLGNVGHAAEFIKDQYRHAKPILAIGAGRALVENAGVPAMLPSGDPDPGLLRFGADEVD
jgi:catalase